jgi:hypothetical protein
MVIDEGFYHRLVPGRIDQEGTSEEEAMRKNPANTLKISASINLLAGVLWILAAFHPITGDAGVDYLDIVLGIFFLAAGGAA